MGLVNLQNKYKTKTKQRKLRKLWKQSREMVHALLQTAPLLLQFSRPNPHVSSCRYIPHCLWRVRVYAFLNCCFNLFHILSGFLRRTDILAKLFSFSFPGMFFTYDFVAIAHWWFGFSWKFVMLYLLVLR